MTADQIHKIVSGKLFPGIKTGVSMLETHISWLILSDEFVFKLKKPVRFDFLDFSTPELREHFCLEELRLNRRLAPEMYLRVLPVTESGIGVTALPAIDHALQMRRMDNSREMDKLLLKADVRPEDMEHLAALLGPFHKNNRLQELTYKVRDEIRDFADLFSFKPELESLKVPEFELLDGWAAQIPVFLKQHATVSEARVKQGFWVEGHGDLHSRNIFLPLDAPPIVFDCQEFNPHFRRIDVLNELAFLCMDLEYYSRPDLAEKFLEAYSAHWRCMETEEDRRLFIYYKAYRANVRLKVNLLEWRQHPAAKIRQAALAYWSLLKAYMAELKLSS